MATYTSNLNLVKPDGTETVKRSDFNGNMEKIDAEAGFRNQQKVWNTEGMTLSQFIDECETMMGTKKGLTSLGYINAAVTNPWGLDFNGYVFGLYNSEGYKAILIVSSWFNLKIGKIAKSGSVWDTTIRQITENRFVVGQSVSTLAFEGYGYVTQGGTKIVACFPMAGIMTVVPTLLTGSRFEVRGITGYVGEFTSGNSVELVGNSNYTVNIVRRNGAHVLEIDIIKASGTYNVLNNTPVTVHCAALNLQF